VLYGDKAPLEEKDMEKTPSEQRMEALRLLPQEVIQTMTKEEIRAFLFDEEWPDTLKEKLKEYLQDI
jgi:hypothetical protein